MGRRITGDGGRVVKRVNYFALFGVISFNVIVFSGIAIALAGLLFSLWTIVISFVVSPVLLTVVNVLEIQQFNVLQTIFSVILFFVGIGLAPLAMKATRFLGTMFAKYVEFNKKAVYKMPDVNTI